ncbi:ATP-grasp fold amidoligase family protein [Glutamicibacter sp. NPDC087661]|uniref:ATP-grasp fold amidoligase family protein n=1 Tax=Glutamicibacter sp. NPDC087661 TaxID=3363996 RepID=UPI003825B1BB
MKAEQINQDASNVNIRKVYNPTKLDIDPHETVSRYVYEWNMAELHALLINKSSDTLVVSFHGAVDRTSTRLPRFERLKSLKERDHSSMFIADPTLFLDKNLSLSWYVGWQQVDVQRLIAKWIVKVVEQLNIRNLILCGSSGGGFTALQVASFIPNCVALAFNAQTDISKYLVDGESPAARKNFIRVSRPDLWEEMNAEERQLGEIDWETGFDSRYAPVERYKQRVENYVYIVQNEEEFHFHDHYLPFVKVLQTYQRKGTYRTAITREGTRHNPPLMTNFIEHLDKSIAWASKLPPAARSTSRIPGRNSWFDLMSERIAGNDRSYDTQLENKIHFDRFCRENSIPTPELLAVLSDLNDLNKLPKNDQIVLKPVESSSSRGVLVLKRHPKGFLNLANNEIYSAKNLIDFYKDLFEKYPQENNQLMVQVKIHDRGKYTIPRDFKLYVFNGEVEIIQCIDRNETPNAVSWCDANFVPLSKDQVDVNSTLARRTTFASPTGLADMKILASKVATLIGTEFLRVDFYMSGLGPICGEVTFTPGGPYFEQIETFTAGFQMELGLNWSQNNRSNGA